MNQHVFPRKPALFFLLMLLTGLGYTQEKTGDKQELLTNQQSEGTVVTIEFRKGLEHYHPLMAVWVEDMEGHYMHTLYVAQSIAKGVFKHANYEDGSWKRGEKKIPAALPYWSHSRNAPGPDSSYMPTPDHPVPDAYTGATPTGSFTLTTVVADSVERPFRVLFEINQSWDWNEHWYNSKYPGNKEYLKSAQPALVYEAVVDRDSPSGRFKMEAIGHSHPYGANGKLFEDISTLTTARQIADEIVVKVAGKGE